LDSDQQKKNFWTAVALSVDGFFRNSILKNSNRDQAASNELLGKKTTVVDTSFESDATASDKR